MNCPKVIYIRFFTLNFNMKKKHKMFLIAGFLSSLKTAKFKVLIKYSCLAAYLFSLC